jgi:hypothetical protein
VALFLDVNGKIGMYTLALCSGIWWQDSLLRVAFAPLLAIKISLYLRLQTDYRCLQYQRRESDERARTGWSAP